MSDDVLEAMKLAMRQQPNGWRIDESAMLRAALRAAEEAGWRLVPVEAIKEALTPLQEAFWLQPERGIVDDALARLSAAPKLTE